MCVYAVVYLWVATLHYSSNTVRIALAPMYVGFMVVVQTYSVLRAKEGPSPKGQRMTEPGAEVEDMDEEEEVDGEVDLFGPGLEAVQGLPPEGGGPVEDGFHAALAAAAMVSARKARRQDSRPTASSSLSYLWPLVSLWVVYGAIFRWHILSVYALSLPLWGTFLRSSCALFIA